MDTKRITVSISFSAQWVLDRRNDEKLPLETLLDEIEKKQDMQTADRIRTHVLNFAEDLRRGNTRTKEDFDLLLDEDKAYEKIIEKYGESNNVYCHAIKFVNKKYDEFMEIDGFAKY